MLLIMITALYFFILFYFFIGLFFANNKTTDRKYFVSVVVAARNEEKYIGKLLNDLTHQTYSSGMYEILIVNDGSKDKTGEIINEFVRNFAYVKQIIAEVSSGNGLKAKKNALNQGIQQSKGELILTTDADCRLKPNWIETMISYFSDEIGMVVGFSQFGKRKKSYSILEQLQAIDFLSLMAATQGSLNLHCPLAASGQNLAFRRSAFYEVNGYQKIKNRISGDDVLLLQLIHKLTKWKIRFAPSEKSFNYSYPEKTLNSLFNQRKRWASNGSCQFQLNKIFFLFLSIMFLVNAMLFLSFPIYFLIYHSLFIPILCLLIKFLIEFLLILKGAFVYQRLDLIKFFPFWALIQIPYIIFTGILGTLGYFKWKGRSHF